MRNSHDDILRFSNEIKSLGFKSSDFIFPIFVTESNKIEKVHSMPGINRFPVDKIASYLDKVINFGISSIILFGIPKQRTDTGLNAALENGLIPQTVKSLRSNFGKKIQIISDMCVCQYNLTGHCGICHPISNKVNNDKTLAVLKKITISHAESGVDVVAPSSMMDGQVKVIKQTLSDLGLKYVKIMSFAAKHNSSLYSPFRSSNFNNGHNIHFMSKSEYQVSYTNPNQIIREIQFDIEEGSDWVMVKPSLFYLDMIFRIKQKFNFPLVIQNVSGEYSLIQTGIKEKIIYKNEYLLNLFHSFKRAGADKVISYFAPLFTKFLN